VTVGAREQHSLIAGRSTVRTCDEILVAALAVTVSLWLSAGAQSSGLSSVARVLGALNALASLAPIDGNLTCFVDVSGRRPDAPRVKVVGASGDPQSGNARIYGGVEVGAATSKNGTFAWRAQAGKTCQVAMSAHGLGNATADLAASGATGSLVAHATPSYLPWYTSVPSPVPTQYVGVGRAFGAGNIYNSETTSDIPAGTGMLGTGQCYFVCVGSPGAQSHHYLAYGNDINPPPSPGATGSSYAHLGAADDCSVLCPAGVSNQAFGITVQVSPPPSLDTYFVTLDGEGNFAVLGRLYAAAALIAGAGLGTAAPVPSPSPGSLVSYTGLSPGSASSYVKCDYGETTSGMFTCDQPLVASDGLTANCLATLSSAGTSCALLTGGHQQSLFLGESLSNYNQGGFLFDGPADVDLGAGAYASFTGGIGECCTATQTQASIIQLTNNGNGISFSYNSGLTVGSSFTPTRIAGVNASGSLWATGGVQPNSATAGGSGGYAPEAFPLGVAEQHPKILSGSCSVTSPSTACTFPNGFAFTDTTYNCTVSAQGATSVSDSYTRASTSITIYTAQTATFSYLCIR
jgi:hypothetical protein